MKTYPVYKPSGESWMGDVPGHWNLKKVKYVFEIWKRIAGVEGLTVLSITQKGIKVKDIESGKGQLAMDYSKYQLVEVGDFAMNQMDLLTGFVDISKFTGVTSPDYRVFALSDTQNVARYFLYVFQFCYINKIFFGLGQGSSHLGRWRLPASEFNNFFLPFPSLTEQQAIADFLDRKTAQLDRLIAKKQRQIELLQEQRTALINQAVTKGLNPDVPMKDSGVEWLGEIPSHWNVKPLKHIKAEEENAFVDGPFGSNLKTIHFVDDGDVYVIESGLVTTGQFVSGEYKTITREHFETIKRSECKTGDIIIAKIGARFGTSGILPELEKPCVVSGNSLKLTVNVQENSTEFIHYELLSLKHVGAAFELIVNATAQPALSLGRMNEMKLAVPPKAEQEEIVRHLHRKSKKINEAEEKINRHITLLQEYRTALISEAVTGKIDVR